MNTGFFTRNFPIVAATMQVGSVEYIAVRGAWFQVRRISDTHYTFIEG